jgi:transposase
VAVNCRGSGSAQYPPAMMLSVLIYCYATGTFSSRRIEAATYQNLSVRYLSADTHPDHDTIATFRRQNGALMQRAFVQVLELARAVGLLRLGTIALDGTKLRAAASKRATLSARQIEQELARLEAEAASMLASAERADAAEETDGQRLPPELADRQQRRAKLEAARRLLEGRVRQRAAQRQVERAEDSQRPSEPPRRRAPIPRPGDTINTTDTDSGLMPTAREGFVQGYNAQLAVSVEGGLIVAARVSDATNDRRQPSHRVWEPPKRSWRTPATTTSVRSRRSRIGSRPRSIARRKRIAGRRAAAGRAGNGCARNKRGSGCGSGWPVRQAGRCIGCEAKWWNRPLGSSRACWAFGDFI